MKKITSHIIRLEQVFVVIAILIGFIYIKITPPLWGLDETAHFARAYQISNGDISPPKSANGAYGGKLPKNLVILWNYTKQDLLDNKTTDIFSRKDVDSSATYNELTSVKFSRDFVPSPGSALYSPVAYIGPVIGIVTADILRANIGHTLFLARAFSLFVYTSLVYLAIWLLKKSKLKWLIFITALLPVCLYQASAVTADNLAIGLSLLYIALLIRLCQDGKGSDDKLLYALIGIGFILPLVKINYIFLSFALVILPSKMFTSFKKERIIKSIGVLLAILSAVGWFLVSNVTSSSSVSQRPDGINIIPSQQIAFIINHPLAFVWVCLRSVVLTSDSYLQSMTTQIGWNYVSMPVMFMFILILGLFLSSSYAKRELLLLRRKLLYINTFALGGIMSIFAALYIAFTPTAHRTVEGIQGRYFLPFLVPVIMLIASYLPLEVKIKDKMLPYVFITISTLCLIVSVIFYYLATY